MEKYRLTKGRAINLSNFGQFHKQGLRPQATNV